MYWHGRLCKHTDYLFKCGLRGEQPSNKLCEGRNRNRMQRVVQSLVEPVFSERRSGYADRIARGREKADPVPPELTLVDVRATLYKFVHVDVRNFGKPAPPRSPPRRLSRGGSPLPPSSFLRSSSHAGAVPKKLSDEQTVGGRWRGQRARRRGKQGGRRWKSYFEDLEFPPCPFLIPSCGQRPFCERARVV